MPESIDWSKLTHFNEKQQMAQDAVDKYKYLLYGGAMGGGKSYFLRWIAVRLLAHYFKTIKTEQKEGIRVGLFCEDYRSLDDRHISKINYEFPSWLGHLNKGNMEYTLSPEFGSGVIAFRNLDDPSKYASAEFAAVLVDEVTRNKKVVFDFLRTRMRWPGISDVKFVGGTNPGSIGHAWVKAMWMDGVFEENEKERDQFHYIRATAYDNSANLDDSYFQQLEGLPEKMRKAYLEGDWDLFEGQYFSEWRNDVHVTAPFKIPDSWRKFGGYDHGRANPACFKWYAIDYDGNIWNYRELYVNKADGSPRWDADKIAREVLRITNEAGEYLEYVVADSAVFSKIGTSETVAEVLMKNGIGKKEGEVKWKETDERGVTTEKTMKAGAISTMIPSAKDRVAGWMIMHQYLYHDETTLPKLRYFSTCVDSIRTIPSLVHYDPTRMRSDAKMEDLDTGGEDHCADVDRYFLQTLKEKKAVVPKTEAEVKSELFHKKLGINQDDPLGLSRFNV